MCRIALAVSGQALACALGGPAAAQEGAEPVRPNILFILMDNLGYGHRSGAGPCP